MMLDGLAQYTCDEAQWLLEHQALAGPTQSMEMGLLQTRGRMKRRDTWIENCYSRGSRNDIE
jgi:hypothetical protein